MPIRILTAMALLFASFHLVAHAQPRQIDVWIGTSSARPSRGIYHCLLDTKTGKLSETSLAAEVAGPGFLAMHPGGSQLYAVCSVEGRPSVAAFAIGKQPGHTTLSQINAVGIGDGGGTHVAIDSTGRTLLTAQYGGGSVAAFSLNSDGSIRARTHLVDHKGGSNVVPGRQDKPHTHWVGFSPDRRFAFAPDLGMDQVVIYEVDVATAKNHSARVCPSTTGRWPPSHEVPHQRQVDLVLNELDLSVTVFNYNATFGTMTPTQTIPTVPKEQLIKEKFKSASEIRVHPNGRFVYSANRGHDTITVFRVNQENGHLTVVERESIRGATPRNFNLDPSGRWLIAAGQDSHTLASFEVNADTGELTYNRSNVYAPSPICVLLTHE